MLSAMRGWGWWVNGLSASPAIPVGVRRWMLRRAGLTLDDTARVRSHCFLGSARITMGPRSYLAPLVYVDGSGPVEIRSGSMVGTHSRIVTGSHDFGDRHHRVGDLRPKPVVIEESCWVGVNVTILPGITIARGCIIGADSTITEDTEPDGLYVGSPARRVRDLD